MRQWAAGLQEAALERRSGVAADIEEGARSLGAAVAEVRQALAHRARSTQAGHFYAARAFALWLAEWPAIEGVAATAAVIEDCLCVYTLARRHESKAAPIIWPSRLSRKGVRAHTMAVRGAIRTAFALSSEMKFAHHTRLLASMGCSDAGPVRAYTFPSEAVEAWRAARAGDDLMFLSWSASLVVASIFGLRPGYWSNLTRKCFAVQKDFLLLAWQDADKSAPARFGEQPGERAPRVSAADHEVLREVIEEWFSLVESWGSEWLFPVVQPLRVPEASPRGAKIVEWRGRRWCVWAGRRRTARWFGEVLRATAAARGWPRAADRKPHGVRGGRSLEARICGVSREVRSGFCWWSLRFMGMGAVYEPPTLGEMVASTRDHWGTVTFDVVKGIPVPLAMPAAAPAAPRAVASGGAGSPGRARSGGRGRGRAARAPPVAVADLTDSSSDDGEEGVVEDDHLLPGSFGLGVFAAFATSAADVGSQLLVARPSTPQGSAGLLAAAAAAARVSVAPERDESDVEGAGMDRGCL